MTPAGMDRRPPAKTLLPADLGSCAFLTVVFLLLQPVFIIFTFLTQATVGPRYSDCRCLFRGGRT